MEQPLFFKKTYSEFLNHLSNHCKETASKFVAVKTQSTFNVEKVYPSKNQFVHWKEETPYFNFGVKLFQCHLGKDMNLSRKKKYAEKRDKEAEMNPFIKRYNFKTKKLGCSATFQVNRVIWMPEYKISGALSQHYDHRKTSIMIRRKLENGESVGEEGYIYNLPSIEEHSNHVIGDVTEPVDSRVRDYICQLMRRGETNALVIFKLLRTFVKSQLNETNRLQRRFYPKLATVRRIISMEKSFSNPIYNHDNLIQLSQNVVNEEVIITSGLAEESSENGDGQTRTANYQELPLRGRSRRHVVNECNAMLKSLQSIVWNLDDSSLYIFNDNLKKLFESTLSKVSVESSS